jgi:hypothetical protein
MRELDNETSDGDDGDGTEIKLIITSRNKKK